MSGIPSISLEQLTALNDEIAALIRAGVPLDKGLTDLAGELRGRQGQTAAWVADRLASGEPLDGLLARDDTPFPPVWRAVVRAGMRSGNLAAALEQMAETGRQLADLRRTIGLALVYPVILIVVGYLLFLLATLVTAPVLGDAFANLTESSSGVVTWLTWMGKHVWWWAPWVPLVLLIVVTGWWLRARRLPFGKTRGAYRKTQRFRFWPSLRSLLNAGRMATFSELLALLHGHDVPLPEALVLAADTAGDAEMSRDARQLADRISAGQLIERRADLPPSLPPLLAWSVAATPGPTNLQTTLLNSARMYREQAELAARWAATYMPIYTTVVLGGLVVLFNGLLLFLPVTQLLYALQAPI